MLTALGDEQSGTRLAHATVLVAGGNPSSAERYDASPAAGRPRDRGRDVHQPDRPRAVTGRDDPPRRRRRERDGDRADFNPATSTWAAADPLTQGRFVRSAWRLSDGTVLAVTSSTTDPGGTAGAEWYDPRP